MVEGPRPENRSCSLARALFYAISLRARASLLPVVVPPHQRDIDSSEKQKHRDRRTGQQGNL